jgi:hypothetical protein
LLIKCVEIVSRQGAKRRQAEAGRALETQYRSGSRHIYSTNF